MRRRIISVLLAVVILLGVGVYSWARFGPAMVVESWGPQPYSREAFDVWLAADPQHADDFRKFSAFLAARRLDRVVPAWQLMRTDSRGPIRCKRPQFLVPPALEWRHIEPVLELARDQIAPVIGPIEAVSAYRTIDFNSCIGGASRSKHLGFAAVDFIALKQRDNRTLFAELCAIQRKLGPRSRFGLGAYFDPKRTDRNEVGRFHVDASGFRDWGSSKHSDSSGCNTLVTGSELPPT